ncbi:MAG: tRNA (adenosine(37)-N6)-threonylcarbamoyltransferase complex transferase subunit TsaD [Clostridia bacterium]|nr:tRNA (adenosine(37)-N6)-threonylcarbamoyltransferase complex transferase subunit TsaD [Clostridia bacterium]MDD4386743.1 tRNA (adenosine(37)-N6)-threonylcarbamoyltransferase complex transferase subunit TsaD [Clostridia bacterium]
MIGLVIESSCDETSVSIIKNGREILSNIVSSQIEIHKQFGGVVPEIASRHHVSNISYVVEEALDEANITFNDLKYIGVTNGPGLVGALLVGVSYAKSLAYALNIPIVPVHHIEGHIAANYISHPDLKPPFLALVVSGGHSHLIYVKDYTKLEIIAKTRDDAVGEAFDKVARTLGLSYPGGPEVSELAKKGVDTYKLPKSKFENYDFSFSGIKTAVINLVHKEKENIRKEDIAKSFEVNVVETLVEHTMNAMIDLDIDTVVLAGGVAANTYLRKYLASEANKNNFKSYIPELKYCTDNAAMIASAAYYNYICEEDKSKFDIFNNLDLNAKANLKIGGN